MDAVNITKNINSYKIPTNMGIDEKHYFYVISSTASCRAYNVPVDHANVLNDVRDVSVYRDPKDSNVPYKVR